MTSNRFRISGAIAAACALAIFTTSAPGQDLVNPVQEVSDSLFQERPREPITYYTSYDRNIISGTWYQSLGYHQSTDRLAFGVDAGVNSVSSTRGLESEGVDGDVLGRLDWRATPRWTWSLDGRFNMVSKTDPLSTTDLRQNRLQLKTQYTINPVSRLTATGILFSEFQQDQSVGGRTIPLDTLIVPIDTTVMPPIQDVYLSHTGRDSSFTHGRRDGFNGSATWRPANWLEIKGVGVATRFRPTTETLRREFWAPRPGEGATLVQDSLERLEAPNGDERYEARARYTGLVRTTMELVLRDLESDQEFYALTRRAQEHLSYGKRTGSFHLEHAPIAGAQVTLDGAIERSLREFSLQNNLNSLATSRSASLSCLFFRPEARAAVGIQVSRARNERQTSQNGVIINRALNASGMRRMTRRLWLDATGSISLYSRDYTDDIADKDDARSYINVGGGYRVSPRCSTTVHFSTNRSHAVAINPSTSGSNNILTTYQMDASLRVQVTPTLAVLQNYQLNANYMIHDFDFNEQRNTLNRIRKIDTVITDSLFRFGFVRLTHNFFFQDRGNYIREPGRESRTYFVSQELYQQNLSLMAGIRPFRGILFTATQSLSNTRIYFPDPALNTIRNRWNLNLGAEVDRALSGGMALRGSIQRIGEYTEPPNDLPVVDAVDYWIAALTFSKDF